MVAFKAILLDHVPAGDRDSYQSFALPSAHFLLTEPGGLAIEARHNNELIGLLLAQIYPHNQTAQLFSLYIHPDYRRQGIGNRLFGYFQDYSSHDLHLKALGFDYEQTSPYSEAMEKIVLRHGWPPPKLYLLRLHFEVADFNPPWFQRYQTVPDKFKLIRWENFTQDEKIQIMRMEEQGVFLPYLSPFHKEESIEPINSLGLRYGGKIMGWCITHRKDQETISYSALFVDSDLHTSGIGIAMLCHAIQLQKDSPVPSSVFEVNLMQINRPWKRFIHKRLTPYACRVERMKWATMLLN